MSSNITYGDAIKKVFDKEALENEGTKGYFGGLIAVWVILAILGAVLTHLYYKKQSDNTAGHVIAGGVAGAVVGLLVYVFLGAYFYKEKYKGSANTSSA